MTLNPAWLRQVRADAIAAGLTDADADALIWGLTYSEDPKVREAREQCSAAGPHKLRALVRDAAASDRAQISADLTRHGLPAGLADQFIRAGVGAARAREMMASAAKLPVARRASFSNRLGLQLLALAYAKGDPHVR